MRRDTEEGFTWGGVPQGRKGYRGEEPYEESNEGELVIGEEKCMRRGTGEGFIWGGVPQWEGAEGRGSHIHCARNGR